MAFFKAPLLNEEIEPRSWLRAPPDPDPGETDFGGGGGGGGPFIGGGGRVGIGGGGGGGEGGVFCCNNELDQEDDDGISPEKVVNVCQFW